MFGFDIIINGIPVRNQKTICYNNITCTNYMIDKFQQDKLFVETDHYIVILDGVVLNRVELMQSQKKETWIETLLFLYKTLGDEFFLKLRGSFSGAIFEKQKNKWLIFGDQIGSKFVYYAKIGDFFCCSSVMGHIYDILRENNIKYNLSTENALLMLTYGFMIDNRTLSSDIFKITPGCYIVFENNKLTEKRAYLLNPTIKENISEDDAIELVDHLFRKAVGKQFQKDQEAGFSKHLVALSGGLDCRMTSFVAHDLGYTKQLNMTFSQSNYWDEIIPKKMASDLKHEWIFKALDQGIWLYDVDEVTRTTGGNVLYYGTAHGNSLIKYLNMSSLGMMHSGQIGDVIIGSFIKESEINKPYKLGSGAYSKKYLSNIKNILPSLELSKEIGLFYYRAFNGTNNGLQNIYNYTETLSPFLYLEFLETCLSLPVAIRQNHYLYKKWILKKYPKAANYVWETTGQKISAKELKIGDRSVPFANIPKSIMAHLRMYLNIKKDRYAHGMNPVGYYLDTNSELQRYLFDYFKYIEKIEDQELREIIIDIRDNGTAMEEIQAVTLLGALKMYY